jgi:hypothetical protein
MAKLKVYQRDASGPALPKRPPRPPGCGHGTIAALGAPPACRKAAGAQLIQATHATR